MKTFKEFQKVILEKSPGDFVGGRQNVPSNWQGDFLSKGKPNPMGKPNTLRMLTTNPAINSFLRSRAIQSTIPNSAAVVPGLAGGIVLSKLATRFGNWRRQQVQQRRDSMIAPQKGESGYYGPGQTAQIKPLR